jgi:hypothetical protein
MECLYALRSDPGDDPGDLELRLDRLVGAVVIWLWLNPRVFPAVTEPRSWAAKGIYGEKLWLLESCSVPLEYRVVLRWLIVPGLCGIVLLAYGLVALRVWPTAFGATLIVLAQLWRIDRLGLLYERGKDGQSKGANAAAPPERTTFVPGTC